MRGSDRGLETRLLHGLIGASTAFLSAIALVHRFARSKAPILITGETGTGKEFAAHAAHYLSDRSDAAFIPINCGALPDTLIESELFGHVRGAFTDASRARPGLVREAEGGTLLLDEVEALSPRGQVLLLRFLQDASFRSVGEDHSRCADVRIIAASNVDLRRLVERGGFRSDLLFRLDVLSVTLPPLRERIDDILLLVRHLLAKAARSEGGAPKTVSPAALAMLCSYSWPGNVRELEHVLLRAHLLSAGQIIDRQDLQECSTALMSEQCHRALINHNWLREEKLRAVSEVERRFVEHALSCSDGNISEAARMCHMERAAFSRMAKKCRHTGNLSLAAEERSDVAAV